MGDAKARQVISTIFKGSATQKMLEAHAFTEVNPQCFPYNCKIPVVFHYTCIY